MSSPVDQRSFTAGGLPHTHPLDEFYANAGLVLPRIDIVPGVAVPEPQKTLLVHQGDMTPTLEKFHESTIHLQVIRREKRGNFYYREVLLRTDDENKPVEFGAIKIFLDLFPVDARNDVLSERLPLGTILAKHNIPHLSRPKAYLRVTSDQHVNHALELTGQHQLYGRRNTLKTPDNQPLAEIVEILPPALE